MFLIPFTFCLLFISGTCLKPGTIGENTGINVHYLFHPEVSVTAYDMTFECYKIVAMTETLFLNQMTKKLPWTDTKTVKYKKLLNLL